MRSSTMMTTTMMMMMQPKSWSTLLQRVHAHLTESELKRRNYGLCQGETAIL
jgi:hypothetical protein